MSMPGKLARFAARRPRDQVFALRGLAVVLAMRVGLSTLGYRRMRRFLPDVPPGRQPTPRDLARVAWAVTLGSRFVPGASCLTQALAGQYLLSRAGIASTIRIGAKAGHDGRFSAHAWLLSGTTVILGGRTEDVQSFAPLVDLGS